MTSRTKASFYTYLDHIKKEKEMLGGKNTIKYARGRRISYLIIIDKIVCKRIAYYRQKLKLSREVLASNVGFSLNHLIKIETGLKIPRINELVQLAAVLGVSIDELVKNK